MPYHRFQLLIWIYPPQGFAITECIHPNSSDTIVSLHRQQISTIFECPTLNLIDRFLNAGVSDTPRSPPHSPVDENIPIKVIICIFFFYFGPQPYPKKFPIIICVVHHVYWGWFCRYCLLPSSQQQPTTPKVCRYIGIVVDFDFAFCICSSDSWAVGLSCVRRFRIQKIRDGRHAISRRRRSLSQVEHPKLLRYLLNDQQVVYKYVRRETVQ